jgi:hypothetical protein
MKELHTFRKYLNEETGNHISQSLLDIEEFNRMAKNGHISDGDKSDLAYNIIYNLGYTPDESRLDNVMYILFPQGSSDFMSTPYISPTPSTIEDIKKVL